MVDSHDAETYSAKDSRLIWIDCEMTGLDIFGGDELVEVSAVPGWQARAYCPTK